MPVLKLAARVRVSTVHNCLEYLIPFYTTKEPSEGAGFYLANCSSIVEQHNRVITAMSEPSKGARRCGFVPVLPAVAENVIQPLIIKKLATHQKALF